MWFPLHLVSVHGTRASRQSGAGERPQDGRRCPRALRGQIPARPPPATRPRHASQTGTTIFIHGFSDVMIFYKQMVLPNWGPKVANTSGPSNWVL